VTTTRDLWEAQDVARHEIARGVTRARVEQEHEVKTRADRVRRMADDALAIGHGPRPVNVATAAGPAESDAWLVRDLIRPGQLVMLAGPPSVAKSWARLQLTCAVGAGLTVFLDRYALPRRLRVLVIDEDNGADEEWRREQAMIGYLEIIRGDLDTVHRISLADTRLDELEASAGQQWLRGLIYELEVDLLILDPISEMHGGKELREDPSFAALRRFLKQLKVDFPTLAVLLVHHTRKPAAGDRNQERTIEDVRGQWGQTPDVIATMSPLGDRRVRWETHKRVPRTSLILEQLEGGPFHLVADDQVRKPSTDDRLLAAIDAGAEKIEEVQIATGIPRSTLFDSLKRLRRAGILAPTGDLRRLD
jgi:hypothetical protein